MCPSGRTLARFPRGLPINESGAMKTIRGKKQPSDFVGAQSGVRAWTDYAPHGGGSLSGSFCGP